jgi:LPPG:FO 2-phospho-L-lactate transferase
MPHPASSYTVLSGGVGGAKLVLGLHERLDAGQLQVIANTGDDFEHLGLTICPDIDTLIYTLTGQANPDTGWGLRNETWQFMDNLEALGGETWFRLGDRDLATHVRRQTLLAEGLSLTDTIAQLCDALELSVPIWPMSDDPVRTHIVTNSGPLPFQDYFVRLQAEPVASGFDYVGSDTARASTGALQALNGAALGGIFIAPSNPWLSIDPILSLADIKSAIINAPVPVIGISPIVGGRAIKGPTAKLMAETGLNPSALSIAEHYRDILDGLIIDEQDADEAGAIEALGLQVEIAQTVMNNDQDKFALASVAVGFAASLDGRNT